MGWTDLSIATGTIQGNMSLNEQDKAAVRAIWNRVKNHSDDIGWKALSRMLLVYPQTKIYFSHWKDLSDSSPKIKRHGQIIMTGVADAVAKIDNLSTGLLHLSELHAFTMRVDPANFKLLSHCILVVMAMMYPTEFTPEAHVAMDKFLAALSRALSEKYR